MGDQYHLSNNSTVGTHVPGSTHNEHMCIRQSVLTCAISSLYNPLLIRTHDPCFSVLDAASFTTLITSAIWLLGTIICCHLPIAKFPMSSMAFNNKVIPHNNYAAIDSFYKPV